MLLNDFIGDYLGTGFGPLTDKIEEEFGINLTESNVESCFELCSDDMTKFGRALFYDYAMLLSDKLKEDYPTFDIERFGADYLQPASESEFRYNGRIFQTRKQFEKLLAESK